MATCSHCDYPYATSNRCPKCGSKDPSGASGIFAGILIVIIVVLLFFLSPGIFVPYFLNYFFQFQPNILWFCTISTSLSVIGYLFFKHRDDFMVIYLWICGIITVFIVLLSLITLDNIFIQTITVMFQGKEIIECQYCHSDGCIDISDIESIAFNFELQDEVEVKRFQDWMDMNHPLWVNYNGKYVNLNYTPQYPDRHLNGEGYGICGPQTKTQFDIFKSEYLQSKYPIGACPSCEIEGGCN